MSEQLQQIIGVIMAISVFGLVMSLWIGGVLLWSRKRIDRTREVQKRLGMQPKKSSKQKVLHLWHEGKEFTTKVPDVGVEASWFQEIERQSALAGLNLGADRILLLVAGIFLMTIATTWVVTQNLLLGFGAAVGVILVLRIVLTTRSNKQERLFERQLVDALELAARSLRAGHPLMGAFQLLSEELAAPVRNVFADICQRHEMGADLEHVLRQSGDAASNPDMKLFATSVAIQLNSGGNLADLMDRLARVIRDRIRLNRRVRVLTAQTQLSKRVLLCLPFLVFIALNFVNPEYMSLFYTTVPGRVMLGVGVILLAIGAWIMNKMAQLKY